MKPYFSIRHYKDDNVAMLAPIYERAYRRYAIEHKTDPRLAELVEEERLREIEMYERNQK